jgi:hypothetical protein
MIFAEPGMCRMPEPGDTFMDMSSSVIKRKDVWTTKEEASEYFQSSPWFRGWDPRVLEIAVVSQPSACSSEPKIYFSQCRNMAFAIFLPQNILKKNQALRLNAPKNMKQ